ncbi:hypothetical protein [Salinispora cortesiana]|uniref:hypothetical protein n=1 Tax=Salinispora cortesiana TaxID=1305843 RepID=UPI00040E765B|nr:hypothetical protein [Salinispora cortesiana]
MPLAVAHTAGAPSWIAGLGWGLLAVLFGSLVPYGIIYFGVRRGTLTDHHIGVREQRHKPLGYGLLSVLTVSRVRLRDHTTSQVVAGAVVGALVAVPTSSCPRNPART